MDMPDTHRRFTFYCFGIFPHIVWPAVALLERMLSMLQTIDSNVLSFRKLGVIVFGCWTLLRFKECMLKTLMDESIQVGFAPLVSCFPSNRLAQ